MDSQWSMADLLKLARRRRHLIAAVTLILLCVAVSITFVLPRTYESSALVQVVDTQLLQDLYGEQFMESGRRPAGIDQYQKWLSSTAALKGVVSRLGLDRSPGEDGGEPGVRRAEALVGEIRSALRTEVVATDGPASTLLVSVHANTPDEAQRILTGLVSAGDFTSKSESPEEVVASLAENRQAVVDTRSELSAVERDLRDLESVCPDVATSSVEQIDESRVRDAQRRRDVAGKISLIRPRLEAVRAQLADEEEWVSVPDAPKRVRNGTWMELRHSEEALVGELTALEEEEEALRRAIEESESRRESVAQNRQKWDTLTERRAQLVQDLALRERGLESVVNASYSDRAKGALLVDVLTAPEYPAGPDLPNQLVIAVAGLVLGLGVGLGTALALDIFGGAVAGPREVQELLGLPVLGQVETIETPAERLRRRRRARLATVAIATLFFLTAAALFVQVSSDGDVGPLMARILKVMR